jgi:hypothetical protein
MPEMFGLFSKNRYAWMLALFWITLLILGGGSRADIQSAMFLRPLAILLLAASCIGLTMQDIRKFPFLFSLMLGSFLLIGVQLFPLPHFIWSQLPGHELIADTDRIANVGEIWRPISMIPTAGRNAYFAFFIPLAIFALLIRVGSDTRHDLLGITILAGLINAVIGLLQLIGPEQGPLYFFRITNFGTAVGLFANRNHYAVFLACIIPMLAVFASVPSKRFPSQRFRLIASGSIGAFLFLLIIVAGSRAGFLVSLLGLASTPFLYKKEEHKRRKLDQSKQQPNYLKFWGPLLAVVATLAIALSTSRAVSFNRLFGSDGVNESRFEVWGPISKIAWEFFPFGSGFGTFVDVYKIYEPTERLSPEYLNHAHNDLIEVLMTGGLGALLILLLAAAAWSKTTFLLFSNRVESGRAELFGRLGSIVILMLSIASLSDYPLRTPSLAGLLVIAAVWMASSVKNVQPDQSA